MRKWQLPSKELAQLIQRLVLKSPSQFPRRPYRLSSSCRLPGNCADSLCHRCAFYLAGRQDSEMETGSPLSLSPPPIQSAQASTTIRRHHTISTATRSSRTSNRAVITEEPQEWNEGDEEEEWTMPLAQTLPIAAVGEQKGLHRQASLPAGYTRGMPLCPSGSGI